jgi:hypothetical protein
MRFGYIVLNGFAYDELKRIWKEMMEVYFKAQAQHSPGGTMKYLIQDSWSLGQSFKPRISQT